MKKFCQVLLLTVAVLITAAHVYAVTVRGGVFVSSASSVLLIAASGDGQSVAVTNIGTKSVYIGTSSVTGPTGFVVPANATISLLLRPGDALYGICTTGEVTYVDTITTR